MAVALKMMPAVVRGSGVATVARIGRRRRTAATVPAGLAAAVVLVMGVTMVGQPLAAGGEVRELEWEELMPGDWDPFSGLDALMQENVQDLADGSAQAEKLMNAYRDAVRSAPVVSELDGQQVRLPGFVVPLDFEGTETSEFLLVPYFGACIHVPPPPSNQIVYVTTVTGYPLKELFDPVWVTGELRAEAYLNDVGDAGYTMQATIIEPY